MNGELKNFFETYLNMEYGKTVENASIYELHNALGRGVVALRQNNINKSGLERDEKKRAYYLSAEFLMGRAVFSNLYNLGLLEEAEELFKSSGYSLGDMEDIPDQALGNGGLGRLAACFLDSAATQNVPLDGYGIRYNYGLFKQSFYNGNQVEEDDDWLEHGDPWSIRNENDIVMVDFADQTVKAVPYDMPIFGYKTDNVGNLRLWQSEELKPFDFGLFNDGDYDGAVEKKNRAQDISRVLYPNDSTKAGKRLRLKQQYFLCSASMQDIVRNYVNKHGRDFCNFPAYCAVQINDTHPVMSIPEMIRILMEQYDMDFYAASGISFSVFAYTNHTIMSEALECWDIELFKNTVPQIYDIIVMLNEQLIRELSAKNVNIGRIRSMKIIANKQIHMARLAVFACHSTNGVAKIHTDLIKTQLFSSWNEIYPDRINNKTNGITQRRWLALCNGELSSLITELLGDDGWITALDRLRSLEKFADDSEVISRFMDVKSKKKQELCEYIKKRENIDIDPSFIFDIQIKRLHEYKRQLLNAFSILDIYFGLKDGSISSIHPTVFIFGAKSAPGYTRAKGIIQYINEIAKLVNSDEQTNKMLKVVFVQDYNVSYAEKLIPAADISEQISTAGTEASGTGNMKLMLNGAVTLGTYDGANIEIVAEAGEENNYIFGARVEDLTKLRKTYNPSEIYRTNKRLMRVVDTLVDGTFGDGGKGVFADIYNSLLDGTSWHEPDVYFLFCDFDSYVETKLRCLNDYKNREEFSKKSFRNICGAGKFSSDRTIREYAKDIWNLN